MPKKVRYRLIKLPKIARTLLNFSQQHPIAFIEFVRFCRLEKKEIHKNFALLLKKAGLLTRSPKKNSEIRQFVLSNIEGNNINMQMAIKL